MPKDYAVPIEVQLEVSKRVDLFNKKYLAKSNCKYLANIKGKFIYLLRTSNGNEYTERICRLTYTGNLEKMTFAIFKYSTEKYGPSEFSFSGANHIYGTLEEAMKAGLKLYPI